MKIRTLAWITFLSLLRNKLIVLFVGIFVCVVLFMMTPILSFKSMSNGQGMVLGLLSFTMSMVSGFGSLLAAWSAADAVWGEMKSGTVMAVLARPVHRWEFLLGKYLGAQLLMAVYVVFMFGITNLLARIGGEHLVTSPWLLLVYPMVRYAIYGAIAMLLVTRMHPVVAFVIVLILSVITGMVAPGSTGGGFLPKVLHQGLYFVLPSMDLLSESQFLAITASSITKTPWTHHLTALVYGLNYALVCLLLAAWSFRRRSLARD